MKIVPVALILVSLITWAQAKQNSNQKDRQPAESHGGVILSNEQFDAVTQYALKAGGSLARVFSVEKRVDCKSDEGSIFEIKTGGQSSQTGVESYDPGSLLVVVTSAPKADSQTLDGKFYNSKVKQYKSNNCKAK